MSGEGRFNEIEKHNQREDELEQLRAWKAEARPFLHYVMMDYQHGSSKIEELLSDDKKKFYHDQNEEAIKTLTELLGGSDEN